MIRKLICEYCGSEFYTENKHQRFCSRSCSAKHTNRLRPQRTIESRLKTSESLKRSWGNIHESSIEIFENQKCIYCGKDIHTIVKKREFCCQECRTQYNYEKKVKDWLDNPSIVSSTFIPRYIKRWMFENRGCRCEECGWHEVNQSTGLVPLQIHHIDGDCTNNHPDNLKLLCPNCHSLTDNYGSRNMGDSKRPKNINTLN